MRLQKTTKQVHIALIENISQIIRRKRQQRESDYHDFYRMLSEYTQMNDEDIQNKALEEINQLAEEEAEEIENNNQYHLHGVQIRDAFHY
jgi:glutamyl-tRNA reductase